MAEPFSVVTWNVNSLRVRMEHLTRWLGEHRPDVICLQETKVTDELFPLEPLRDAGYQAAFAGQKTYNGVAVLSREPFDEIRVGFSGDNSDEQKRLLAAKVKGVWVVNAYVPQGSEVDSPKFFYKLDFLADLRRYFEKYHQPDEAVVLVGDLNVAPEPGDVFDPAEMEGEVSFHPKEKAALEHLRAWGFEDLFRRFEKGAGHYSWWDYRAASFRRNRGLRIDHIWATRPLAEGSSGCWIDREERSREKASDHAPMLATFSVPVD